MDIQDLLGGVLGEQAQQVVAQQLGLDQQQAASAVSLALPTLLNALAKNTASQDGAASLFNAITNKHDGSGLGNLAGLAQAGLGGEGAKILGHIFGGQQPQVESALSQNAGIGSAQITQVLQILAPIVLNALGGQQKQQGFDIGGLAGLLTNAVSQQKQQNPQAQDILSQLFDKNNDGNLMDDALKMGAGLLGKFLKK
jgi:hypothetical protein